MRHPLFTRMPGGPSNDLWGRCPLRSGATAGLPRAMLSTACRPLFRRLRAGVADIPPGSRDWSLDHSLTSAVAPPRVAPGAGAPRPTPVPLSSSLVQGDNEGGESL